MRRRTLGRGLSELIPTDGAVQTRAVIDVPLERLSPNPRQPRADIQPDRLEELTLSIEAHGVLQPIVVRPVGDAYEIIAGERRWRASQRAGLEVVPCIVQEADDAVSLEIALIENLQREDLNAVEAARGYRRLLDEFGLTQEGLSRLIGKSRSGIANTLRLLDLPPDVLQSIHNAVISEGHGRALLGLAGTPDTLRSAWETVVEQGLSVREAEQLVRDLLAQPTEQAPQAPARRQRLDPNLKEVQDQIQRALATRVKVKPSSRGGGKIEIRYSDDAELERLIDVLSSGGG